MRGEGEDTVAAPFVRNERIYEQGRLLPAPLLRAMETTIPEGSHVDIPGQRYGLGLESYPTPCGVAWGHNGTLPGYVTFAFSSIDGTRQALLMVNHDAGTLAKPAARLFFKVLDRAYSSAS